MSKIPIVFAFDDKYALPASIAIQSLIDSKNVDTEYDVIVFYSELKDITIKKMETICPINWVKVDSDTFDNVPIGWSGKETYYRLLMADLLPNYDKVIWSDVDVLFKGDISNIYNQDIDGYEWAGVPAERQDERNGVHTHFVENEKPYIYMPGFMIANTKMWREKQLLIKFSDTINRYGEKLKMFDLDVLNLAADKVYPVPFEYCVLENIYDESDIENAPEYPWLERSYGKDALLHARENPVIIHYAGKNPKIWNRKRANIPDYYWKHIIVSPFYNKDKYYPTVKNLCKYYFLKIFSNICISKKLGKELRKKANDICHKK